MNRRQTLTLMEIAVMLLVLALVAGLCIKAFVWADTQAEMSRARDNAMVCLQTVAEQLKANGGSLENIPGSRWENGALLVVYDAQWKVTSGKGAYTLEVTLKETGLPQLGQACLQVRNQAGALLETLEVCWQEGTL